MFRFDATTQAVILQTLFFALALTGAWVVLVLLKGTAKIHRKGLQFGGAAAMFIAMFLLLNKYVPEMRDGIIAEASAAQSQKVLARDGGFTEELEVYLNPARQKISVRDLKDLDKNKYFVDEQFGLAILQSKTRDWSVSSISSFAQIGISDLPLFGMLSNRSLLPEPRAKQIYGVMGGSVHTIIIDRESEIAGFRVTRNPYADEQFMQEFMESMLDSFGMLGIVPKELLGDNEKRKQLIEESSKEISQKFRSLFDEHLAKALPIEKTIQGGVYVSLFDIGEIKANFFSELQGPMSSLDRAFNALSIRGRPLGGTNIKIDQQRRAASFDGSTRLRQVLVDGSRTDVTINNVGFIVVGDQRIVFVQLISLDIDGLSMSLLLKRIMDSLLFVT